MKCSKICLMISVGSKPIVGAMAGFERMISMSAGIEPCLTSGSYEELLCGVILVGGEM